MLPLRHWLWVLAIAGALTAVLFSRCCGHLLAPVAMLLVFPYLLGSLIGGATHSSLEAVGFALGLALELGIVWWLIRATVLLGARYLRRRE